MDISNSCPAPAFARAVAAGSCLRTFSSDEEPILAAMRENVLAPRGWRIADHGDRPGHYWMKGPDGERGYMRSARDRDQQGVIREKLLADIAHDLNLPVTAYMLLKYKSPPTREEWLMSLSCVPAPQVMDIHDAGRQLLAPGGRHDENHTQIMFFKEQPHLAPAFAALAVFDVFAGNSDHNAFGTIVDQQPPGKKHTLLYGIDLENTAYHIQGGNSFGSGYPQHCVLQTLPAASIRQAVEDTLTAIRHYPVENIYKLADRLTPVVAQRRADAWDAGQHAEILAQRAKNMGGAVAKLFPKLNL